MCVIFKVCHHREAALSMKNEIIQCYTFIYSFKYCKYANIHVIQGYGVQEIVMLCIINMLKHEIYTTCKQL